MSAADNHAVFLSYASQDTDAARRICEALRAAGVEVWFDQSELRGGDAWDTKIRQRIKECALFMPVISANTQARAEGYFRLEWRLADQRTHLMGKSKSFLVPISIDDTRDTDADVPDSFLAVQWTRLPGGETPGKFCERVKSLLAAEVAPASSRPSENAGKMPALLPKPKRPPSRSWLVPSIVGIALLAAFAIWQPWKNTAPTIATDPSPPPVTTKAAAAPLTEAQQLVAKARKILDDGDEMNRETYSLAEDLLKRAEALDVAEASAWALHAALSTKFTMMGFDRSAARTEALRSQGERALKLAPNSLEGELAAAQAQFGLSQDRAGVERRLESLAARYPDNLDVLRQLALAYARDAKIDQAVEVVKRALRLSPDDPALKGDLVNDLRINNKLAEAEQATAQALAGRTSGRLLAFDAWFKLIWRGDVKGAAAAVAGWPVWFLGEDRGATLAGIAYLWNHEPAKALGLLQRFPRDYISDLFFVGPRAVLTALAHEQAGHSESARADWQIVIQIADRVIGGAPDDQTALYWKAWALARLGRQAEAENILRLLVQRSASAPSSVDSMGGMAGLELTMGHPGNALADLERVNSSTSNRRLKSPQAFLRFNPVFEPLRGDPRFQVLIDGAPAPETEGNNPGTTAAPAPDQKSVAVLAFANLSDDKDNEFFSDGISEELLNVLAKIPGLKVSARTSSFHFKGKDTPIPEIAQQLGVAYVIEGSVRKSGSKVRITAQLINAAGGFHVWSDNFDRELKDIFAVQDEIAGLIAKNLQLKIGVGDIVGSGTTSPEALQLYLEGRQAWNLRTNAGYDRAEELFNRALELDPRFARAHAALADVWVLRNQFVRVDSGFSNRNSPAQAKILAKINQALALDPNCAEAYTALGGVRGDNWELEEALRDLRRAIAINPNYATAHQWLANNLRHLGFMDEALAEGRRAAELDPLSHRILDNLAFTLECAGRYAEAWEVIERARALRPNSTQIACYRAVLLLLRGRRDEALAEARRLLTPELNSDDPNFARYTAMSVLVACGRSQEAEALLPQFPPVGEDRMTALVYLGRMKEAFAMLDDATPSFIDYVSYGTGLREFDSVRTDPALQAWLAMVGLTEAHARAQAWRAAHPPEKSMATK